MAKVNGTLSGTERNTASIFAGHMSNGFLRMGNPKEEKTGLFGKSKEAEERTEIKKAEVKKKVMRMLKEQSDQDSVNFYDGIEKAGNQIRQSQEIIHELGNRIKEMNDAEKAMREELGITTESQEHQDVALLCKIGSLADLKKEDLRKGVDTGLKEIASLAAGESGNRGVWSSLSEEEWEDAVRLSGQPLSDYQATCIFHESMKKYDAPIIEEEEKKIQEASYAIKGIKKELLKQHGMADTLGQIEELKKAGAKEVIGILRNEALDHTKEKLEEEAEEAKKAAEEKEAQEEQTQKAEGDKGETTTQEKQAWENVGKTLEQDSDSVRMKEKITQILEEEKMLKEELKGLMIDQTL